MSRQDALLGLPGLILWLFVIVDSLPEGTFLVRKLSAKDVSAVFDVDGATYGKEALHNHPSVTIG